MSNNAPGAPSPSAIEPALDERHREFLDYLIQRAWEEFLRSVNREPINDNETQRAA